MDFSLSEKATRARQQIRTLVDEELIPLESVFLTQGLQACEARIAKIRKSVQELGLFAPHMSEDHGGPGFSLAEYGLVSEVMGRTLLGHYAFNAQAPDAGNMELLAKHATELQRKQFLAPLQAGEIRSCFSMTEPDAPGSNPTWMNTRAEKTANGWRINGKKWFTTAADGARFAIVMAVSDPDASKYKTASMFIVPTDTPGFDLVRNISVMGEPGTGWASHAEISYTDVEVPDEYLLGPRGGAFTMAQERLGPGRIHHCMRWLGICERALDMMCARAVTRQVRPGTPLGDMQLVQAFIAESRAEIDAARWLVVHTAWSIDTRGAYAARRQVSTIKFYVAQILQRVLDRAIQVHGALGMTDDTPLAYWFRHERAARIYDGPDEVHKAALARTILKGFQGENHAK